MSTIKATTNESIYKIDKFLGLNENPDGDTKLKLGEGSVCQNWKVTRDLNLRRRPGFKTVVTFASNVYPVKSLWFGNINGSELGLAIYNDKLWKVHAVGAYLSTPVAVGDISTSGDCFSFFPFNNIVYILTGAEYYSYDGTTLKPVEGYVPLVATSRDPTGADSTLLEEVNKLTPKRRVWFSPDGTSTTFVLPESGLGNIDSITDMTNNTSIFVNSMEVGSISSSTGNNTSSTTRLRSSAYINYDGVISAASSYKYVLYGYNNGEYIGTYDKSSGEFTTGANWIQGESVNIGQITPAGLDYRVVLAKSNDAAITISDADNLLFGSYVSIAIGDTASGTVKFQYAPARGVNTIEIGYSAEESFRSDVTGMTNSEIYLGSQDSAIFLYGNGTNTAIYSGIDYDGNPSAEYFPDLNVVSVADENTPITGMIRHGSRLICYKTTSTYSISYGLITLDDGSQKIGFYVVPVNKIIGNAALGQVRLVLNSPFALFGKELYKWENGSPYSSEITRDERMAIRISDKIYSTLATFKAEDCYCYDDNFSQEYYIWYGKKALVLNYAVSAWYYYTAPKSVVSMCNIGYDLAFGFSDGKIRILDESSYTDDGDAFDSYWESGSMDFGKPYLRKFVSEIWTSVKPQEHSEVTVTVMTDKKSVYAERILSSNLATFALMDFSDFSFAVNRKPQVKKLKIKAKKFAFLKFVLKSDDDKSTATVLMLDPKIRETGYVK